MEDKKEEGVERAGCGGYTGVDAGPEAEAGKEGGTLTPAATREMVRFFSLPRLFFKRHS